VKRKKIVLLTVTCSLAVFLARAQATPTKRYDETTKTCRTLTMENDLRGYQVFREFCKECHSRKNEQAKFLYSESKMPNAWNRVFFKKYPECAKNGAWDQLTLEDQLKLNDYLFRTGAGSYDPNNANDCG